MSIVKIIEVIATSSEGFEAAVQNAVDEASKSVKNIESVYVKEMNCKVDNNKVTTYAVNAKVSFKVDN